MLLTVKLCLQKMKVEKLLQIDTFGSKSLPTYHGVCVQFRCRHFQFSQTKECLREESFRVPHPASISDTHIVKLATAESEEIPITVQVSETWLIQGISKAGIVSVARSFAEVQAYFRPLLPTVSGGIFSLPGQQDITGSNDPPEREWFRFLHTGWKSGLTGSAAPGLSAPARPPDRRPR